MCLSLLVSPPVDLHWFFEISIRTEKKIQLELKKNFSNKLTADAKKVKEAFMAKDEKGAARLV